MEKFYILKLMVQIGVFSKVKKKKGNTKVSNTTTKILLWAKM